MQQLCSEYRIQSMDNLQHYFDNHAAKMRADGLQRFGEKFKASRRIKSILHSF